jgi:preprotein translocase subunit SecF
VLLTVLALYFFGGPVLNDFAFSFVVGVIVGTYSSIFVASPIVLWCSKLSGRKAATVAVN